MRDGKSQEGINYPICSETTVEMATKRGLLTVGAGQTKTASNQSHMTEHGTISMAILLCMNR